MLIFSYDRRIGDRICYVALNNNKRIYFGYPSTPPNNKSEQNCVVNVGDLQFKTFGASDFFGIRERTTLSRMPEFLSFPLSLG